MILRFFVVIMFLIVVKMPVCAATNSMVSLYLQQKGTFLLQTHFSLENRIYEINNIIDLGGKSITIPNGCILKFRGGKFVNGKICGQNTKIDARKRLIFGHNLELSGSWDVPEVYPEWFGALGNGYSDDTESIRRAIQFANGKRLRFSRKTYLVNVTPGNDNNVQRIIFFNCKCTELLGKGTIIKLGNNSNCNLYMHKGFGSLFSVYSVDSFVVKGISFDFNYSKNPIWQTQGIRQGIQENTQQNAFQFRRVRKVVIVDCNFIGHSGTNCIDYSDAEYNKGDKVFEVTIQNCKFLKCGGKSFYMKGNTIYDAYHDNSLIAIHYRGSNHDTPYIINVQGNYFEGIGGNAYNVIEADASVLNFSRNTIKKFATGIYLCSDVYDGRITIRNNKFRDVTRAIKLWMHGGTDIDSYRYAYDTVEIIDNECSIDMGHWQHISRYDNIEKLVTNRYGFILTAASGNNKSVRTLLIKKNRVLYTHLNGVSPEICTKAVINLDNAGKSVLMMKCERLEITDNKFYNPVFRVLHNSLFQEIDNLIFRDNYIYRPFSINKGFGTAVIYLNHYKEYTPSLDKPVISNFTVTGNNIIYSDEKNNVENIPITNSAAMTSGLIKNFNTGY